MSARLPPVPDLNTDQASAAQNEQHEPADQVPPVDETRAETEPPAAAVNTESTATVRATLVQIDSSQADGIYESGADTLSVEKCNPHPVASISGSVENLS